MNEFDKKMNALRLQFKAEQKQITKDAFRHVGHLNTAIGMVPSPEVREALRAEKKRVLEAMRTSHMYNRRSYMHQLELLQNQYFIYREKNTSKTKLRRIMAQLCQAAEAEGKTSVSIWFGENKCGTITFG